MIAQTSWRIAAKSLTGRILTRTSVRADRATLAARSAHRIVESRVRGTVAERRTRKRHGEKISVPFVIARSAFVVEDRYFARGFGRTWNFTTFGRCPLPPSWCQGVYIE